jgi:hypothetical protein
VISDAALAALLAGAEPRGSAPQLRTLAETLTELTGKPGGDELDGEAETLAAFRNQFGAPGPARRPHRRSRWLPSHPRPVRAAAAGAAALALGAFATAAYAGALPAPVQRLAHEIIAAPSPSVQPATGRSPAARPVTGHPAYGLCTAWARAKAHGSRAQRAAAFGKLAAAAGGPAKVTSYCAAVARHAASASHRPHPAPHGSGKPGGLPSPRGSGKPSDLPAPHGSGKPSGVPSPHGSGKASGLPAPAGTGGPAVHPTGKPGASGQGALSAACGHVPAAAGMSGCPPKVIERPM